MLHPPKIPNRIDPPLPPEFHQPPSSKFLHRVLSFKLHLPANSNLRGKRDSRENTAVNILLNEWPIKRPLLEAPRASTNLTRNDYFIAGNGAAFLGGVVGAADFLVAQPADFPPSFVELFEIGRRGTGGAAKINK